MLTRTRVLALAAFVPGVTLAQQQAAPPATTAALAPPMAAVREHRFDEHGTVRIDQYYWLRDRDNPEVIKYLQDENAYTKAVMAHTEALQDRLFEELKGRVRRGYDGPAHRVAAHQESAHRRDASRSDGACHGQHGVGRRQPDAVLHETRFGDATLESDLPSRRRDARRHGPARL